MKNFYTYVKVLGNTLYFRGIRDGQRVKERQEYSPVLFHPTHDATSEFHALDGTPLAPQFFDSIRDARDYLKRYKDVSGFSIYGQTRFEYAYIADEYPDDVIEWSPDQIVIAYIDIEVDSSAGFPEPKDASHSITAITVKLSNDPLFYVWGTGAFKVPSDNIMYRFCACEEELLESFLQFWNEAEPDVVSGWNVKTFDIPYVYHRLIGLFGETVARRLSPFGYLSYNEDIYYGKPIISYDILGIATLDYLQLFRKYAPNASQESYKLDHIANVELKEKKLSFEEYEVIHKFLSTKSDRVVVSPQKKNEDLQSFEKWCRVRDRIKSELERR